MNSLDNYYYQEWISLSKEDQERLFSEWNTQIGEGFKIAIMALAKLVILTNLPVAQANVGIYHGGSYLLKICLSSKWENQLANEMVSNFDGFPVFWTNYKNEWIGGFRMGG
jgi:hypothetical protein